MPTVTDPHTPSNPIMAMPDAQALATIASYLRSIEAPAAQLPQAASDASAAAGSGGAGQPGTLISPLQQALLPLEETYAATFPGGDTSTPEAYATRLLQIAQNVATASAPSPFHGGQLLVGGGGAGGITTPAPPQGDGASGTAKKTMNGWTAVAGIGIVVAGVGALWYMNHRRRAPHAREDAAEAAETEEAEEAPRPRKKARPRASP